MITMHVDGEQVGTTADLDRMLPEFARTRVEVQLRDTAGVMLARIVPAAPICPWDPSITREELDRRSTAGGGIPLSDFWKRMGVE